MNEFKTYHPIVNFIYFVFVIGFSMFFMHPVSLAVSLVCSFAYSVLLKGREAVKKNLAYMLPMLLAAAVMNPAFNHRGMTVLAYLPGGNPLTLESIVYGVVAAVMIAGVCFGGETGLLVGAITGFVSNFFLSQGAWTPWQMFAFGIIGFMAGVLFQKGFLRKTKPSLCIFGGLATFFIYGGIMNPASVIIWQPQPTAQMFILEYLKGIPFDLIHAASTVFFLWFAAEPMIDKLDRIKTKYGLVEK